MSLSVASRAVCVRFLLLKFNLFAFVAIDLDTWRFSCSRFTFRDQSLLFVCEQLPTWPAPTVPATPLADVELLLVAVVVEPRVLQGTGVDRWGTGGGRVPPTFQLGGDHIGNVPPTFLLKKWKISCVLSPSNLHSLSACVIDTGVYK